MPNISINAAELFAVEEGSGDPVVLVHGSLADYRIWLLPAREFSKRHKVIAYSRRYHFPNASLEHTPHYSIVQQAEDLAEVIRIRAGGRAHVITSSFGGCVALSLAVADPGLFRSLVLCEPPLMPWLQKTTRGKERFATVKEAQEAADHAFKAGRPRDGVRLFSDMAMGPGVFDAMPPRAQARIMDNAFELALEMAAPLEIYFPRFDCDQLERLTVRVLLLSADRSPS